MELTRKIIKEDIGYLDEIVKYVADYAYNQGFSDASFDSPEDPVKYKDSDLLHQEIFKSLENHTESEIRRYE